MPSLSPALNTGSGGGGGGGGGAGTGKSLSGTTAPAGSTLDDLRQALSAGVTGIADLPASVLSLLNAVLTQSGATEPVDPTQPAAPAPGGVADLVRRQTGAAPPAEPPSLV